MKESYHLRGEAMIVRPWVAGVGGLGMFRDLPGTAVPARTLEGHLREARRLRAVAVRAALRRLWRALTGPPRAAAGAGRDGGRARRAGSRGLPPLAPAPGR